MTFTLRHYSKHGVVCRMLSLCNQNKAIACSSVSSVKLSEWCWCFQYNSGAISYLYFASAVAISHILRNQIGCCCCNNRAQANAINRDITILLYINILIPAYTTTGQY